MNHAVVPGKGGEGIKPQGSEGRTCVCLRALGGPAGRRGPRLPGTDPRLPAHRLSISEHRLRRRLVERDSNEQRATESSITHDTYKLFLDQWQSLGITGAIPQDRPFSPTVYQQTRRCVRRERKPPSSQGLLSRASGQSVETG